MLIQLMFFKGCPNAEAARQAIRRCVEAEGISARIEEIDTESPDAPEAWKSWGSPTILVDGVDVGGEADPTGTSCRLYDNPDNRGVPSDTAIRRAMRGELETASPKTAQTDSCC